MLIFQQTENFMKKYLAVLRKCPLFYGIEEAELVRMLGCLRAKTEFFDKKCTVFAEGTRAKYIGIVLSGSVQMTQVDFYGNRSILSVIDEGQVFAEAFACADVEEMPVDVVANEPSEIMIIESTRVMHSCENNCAFHRQLIFNLMRDLATKTIIFHNKIDVTSKRTTREKLIAYLMQEAKRAGSNSFDIPFDRQELADYLAVERSGLSSEIGKLKREGVLESHRKHFTLL